jgi:alpha-D-ribose 1-methylphosphonate 5-triphosphate synthase subunit PhnG
MISQNVLTVLTHAPADAVKGLAETLLETIVDIEVLLNRTGLVMLPATDSVRGTVFHLGEVLISEGHVRLNGQYEGYAACLGRDLEQALAIAIIEAARSAQYSPEQIAAFIAEHAAQQAAADDHLLRSVEATRVEMETF